MLNLIQLMLDFFYFMEMNSFDEFKYRQFIADIKV